MNKREVDFEDLIDRTAGHGQSLAVVGQEVPTSGWPIFVANGPAVRLLWRGNEIGEGPALKIDFYSTGHSHDSELDFSQTCCN